MDILQLVSLGLLPKPYKAFRIFLVHHPQFPEGLTWRCALSYYFVLYTYTDLVFHKHHRLRLTSSLTSFHFKVYVILGIFGLQPSWCFSCCAGPHHHIRFLQLARLCFTGCLLYTSPSPRDRTRSRMPSSA